MSVKDTVSEFPVRIYSLIVKKQKNMILDFKIKTLKTFLVRDHRSKIS